MAEEGDVLGIRATIDAKDVENEANKFIASVERMQKAAERSSDAMSDSFGFLLQQIEKLAPAIDAVRDKLASISGAMASVTPKSSASAEAYEDIKSQVRALTSQNEELKARLTETTASIREQGKATDATASSINKLSNASQTAGSSNGIASIGSKAKGQMKELADEIKMATVAINTMQESYKRLESELANLERRKYVAQNNPTSDNPLAQQVKNNKVANLDSQIEATKMSMSRIKQDMTDYKAEIVQCNQKMAELNSTTARQGEKTVALRTQLRMARQHVSELILGGKQGTLEFGKAVNEANKLQAAFNKASMAISGKSLAVNSLNMLSTSISGVTGAMTTYMGVAGLFASNQEDLVKIQTKLQAVMSISMGVQQMLGAATQISVKWDSLSASIKATIAAESEKATVAKGAEAAANTAEAATAGAAATANVGLAASIKAVATAIYTSVPVVGWILAAIAGVVAGITALYKYLTRLTPAQKAAAESAKYMAEQQKKVQDTMRNQYATVGESIAKYKKLQSEYNNVKNNSKELDRFIKSNSSEFQNMNLSVKNASDAENVFVRNSSAVINGLNMRAKAAAQYQVAVELYTEAYKKQMEAEQYDSAAGYTRTDLSKRDNNKRKRQYRANAEQNRKDANKLTSQANKAIQESNKTESQYKSYMKANGVSLYTPSNKKSSKSTSNDKTPEQIAYENAQKWHELSLEENKAYQDKLSELSDAMLAERDDSAEKSIAEIRRNRDKQLMELDNWVTELAKKRKDVARETWINAGKNRTEYGWSQTKQGQMTDEDWKADLFKNNSNIASVYDSSSTFITSTAASAESKAIDKVIEQYNQQTAERQKKISDLRRDIAFLEKEMQNVTSEAQKANMEIAKNNAQSQLEWLQQSKDAWNEYYTKYGTFLEKKKALDDKFAHDTIGLDENDPTYLMLKKQKEAADSALEAETKLKELDWTNAFGNLAKLSQDTLQNIKQQLLEIIEADEKLNATDKAKFVEKYNQVNEQIQKNKLSFVSGNWIGSIAENAMNKKELKKDYEAKKKAYEEAQKDYDKKQSASLNAQSKASQSQMNLDSFLQKKGSKLGAKDLKGLNTEQAMQALKDSGVDTSQFGEGFQSLFNGFSAASQGADVAASQASEAAQAMSQAGSALQGAEGAMGGGGGGGGAAMAETIIKGVNQNVQSLNELVKEWGDEDSDFAKGMNDFAESSDQAVQAFDSLKSGDLMGVILHLSKAVESLGKSFAHFFGFDGGEREYKRELEHYQKLSKIWDELIDKKTEYLNLSYGSNAIKEQKEIESIYKAELTSLEKLGKAYLSKHSVNAHSAGYRQNKEIGSAGFSKWSDIAGERITSVEDLFTKDLSYDTLVKLMTADNGEIWAKLDEETQDYLNKIMAAKKGIEELGDSLKERLTGVSFDEFKDSFISAMKDMNSSATDMTNNFKQNLRDAILDTMIDKKFKTRLQKLYDDFAKANEDGEISKEEYDRLVEEEGQIAADMQAAKRQLIEQYGWTTDETTSGTSKGFSSMTQDQASELNGRFTAMNETATSIRDEVKVNSQVMAQAASALNQIVVVEGNRDAYYNEAIEIQRTSVGHLAAISKNTAELYGMHEQLQKIERNTRNL